MTPSLFMCMLSFVVHKSLNESKIFVSFSFLFLIQTHVLNQIGMPMYAHFACNKKAPCEGRVTKLTYDV